MSDGKADTPSPGSSLDGTGTEVTPERWQRIKQLLLAAEEIDPGNRDGFLREACGSDEALRAEIESLIEADPGAMESGFSTTNLMRMAGISTAADPMIGRRVGAYEIVRAIGQGGMAVVYLAVRADDAYRKEVAVKLVRSGLDNVEVLNRFRNERQTLASLDHPNIVRLIDGGSTTEGVPYLVMDHVEGVPIDEYCDTHRLSIEQRVRLFCSVCGAVQYAHQKLVVHRDLKPSNILVASEGVPKLLDFGISKVLTPDAFDLSQVVTQTGVRRMTPAYASPEQVRGSSVTPASDIYSLGVVLYELLTGHRPYRLKQQTPIELEHAICEQEPENPSTAVDRVETEISPDGTTISRTPELVSLPREGEPDKLRRRLRGDLDNIVLMALQKEPSRRYASVEEFSCDLQGHLGHLPVRARRRTLAYRISKFAQRRKTEVVVGIALASIVAVALFSYRRMPPVQPRIESFSQITDDAREKIGADLYGGIPSPYVADGSHLYFQEIVNGTLVLAQVPISGGEPVPIATPFNGAVDLLDYSAIRSEFLVFNWHGTESELPLWAVPLGGGPVRRVGNFLATSAAWSPDGQQLLYTHGHELYVCKADGSNSRRVVEVSGLPVLPRLSPTGDVVRFTQYDPQGFTSALWEVSMDGSNLRPLFSGWTNSSCCGQWMANGKYFVFRATVGRLDEIWMRQEARRGLSSMNPEPVQLTAGAIDFYALGVSTDGRKLFSLGLQPRAELERFDPQRSEFVPYLKGISAQISIVGNHLAFTTKPGGQLWSSDLDGGQKLQLSFPPLVAEFPSISPDGLRVAFMAAERTGVLHIYSVSIHGGKLQQLSGGRKAAAYPDWSPDGEKLVFSGLPAFVSGNSGATPIEVVDLRTLGIDPIPGSVGLICPRWSPDGRYLAAKSADSTRLMLYEFDRQKWTELATVSINYLNWSHDGRYVYFDTYPGDAGEGGLYRMEITNRKFVRIVDLKGMRQAAGLFSQPWTGLAPDDSPLILRDISSQEVYGVNLRLP